jgi:hypothetical protein
MADSAANVAAANGMGSPCTNQPTDQKARVAATRQNGHGATRLTAE